MRTYWLITFRTVTYAQRAQRVLQQNNIFCQLQRTPKMLTVRGCGYCLRLREEDVLAAVAILRSEQIAFAKLYALSEDGTPQERSL